MKQEKESEREKIRFSREIAAENILQGGYQVCSDTMLVNMASIDEGEKNLWNYSIDSEM
jgi:hypothetical protein